LVSERMASIHESTTLKISAMAKKLNKSGLDVIDLGVGEPDFATPQNICDACCDSIKNGETHYTPTNGIAELREAIAEKLVDENGLEVTADDVVVTPGAKMAVFAAIQALMQEGDECVLIGPSWVSYEPCVALYPKARALSKRVGRSILCTVKSLRHAFNLSCLRAPT